MWDRRQTNLSPSEMLVIFTVAALILAGCWFIPTPAPLNGGATTLAPWEP